MNRLFELIIESSLYGSITALSILTIKLLLRKKLAPKWTCTLWLLLIIKLVIPFAPESEISMFNNSNSHNKSVFFNKIDSIYMNEFNLSIENRYLDSNKSLSSNSIVDINTNRFDIKMYVPILWFIVAIAICLHMSILYILFSIKLKNSNVIDTFNLYPILRHSKSKFNVNNDIGLIITEYVSTPSLIGIIQPKILLPLTMIDLDIKQIEYIFLHELSHYKRKDNLLNLILIFIQALHWFNPFIWYSFKKLREDIELATDEKVLNILNNNEFDDYGLTLISVLSKLKNTQIQPNLIGMAKNKKNVEKRIMNIKFMKNSKNNKIIFTLVGTLAIGFVTPTILTNGKSSSQVVYANNESRNLTENKLSELQNTYFKLIELKENKTKLDRTEIHKITKSLTMETSNIGDDAFIMDSYKIGSELLRVYYNKQGDQYVVKNIWYYIDDNTKDIYSVRLHYTDNKDSENKLGIEVVTKDVSIVDDISKLLNMNIINSELYEVYMDILKNLDSNKILTEDTILKLNPNAIKITDDNIVKLSGKGDGEDLIIKLDHSNNKVNSIGLGDISFLSNQDETIWTKTENYPSNDFFSNEYSFPKDGSVSVINKFENNIEKIKEYFVVISNTYNK